LDFELTNATQLFIDNQEALDLMRSGQINDKTKHIDTKFRHICDHKEAGDVTGVHVTTENQLADMMTKSLGGEKFVFFQSWCKGIIESLARKGVVDVPQTLFPSYY